MVQYTFTQPSVVAGGNGHNAFPGLAVLPSGRLVVVWRYGTTHTSLNGVIRMAYSDNDGRTWSTPVTVLSASGLDYRDPALMPLADGRLSMMLFISDSGGTTGAHVSYSADGGATWGAPTRLPFGWTYEAGGCSGPLVELEPGHLWAFGYIRDQGRTYRSAYAIQSLNNGVTWGTPRIIADGDSEVMHREEPFAGRLRDGRLMVDVRGGSGGPNPPTRIRIIRNHDGSWTAPTTVVTGAQARPAWIQLSTGEVVVADRLLSVPSVGVYAIQAGIASPLPDWDRLSSDPHETRNTYTQMVELAGGVVATVFCHEWGNGDSRLHFARLIPYSPSEFSRRGAVAPVPAFAHA